MAQAPDAQGQSGQAGQKVVEELKVSAHLMTLDRGLFCVFHAPGSQQVDLATGLPGVRVSLPPGQDPGIMIRTFRDDGWMGGDEGAALVRVPVDNARVLITIYQRPGATEPPPKIQIQQLSEGAGAGARRSATGAPIAGGAISDTAEVAAHVQRRGDVVTALGDWMGDRGSQRWIEGFSIAPQAEKNHGVGREDIEYQAVLGRGWLSPWADGGQYCGSRGMALPILGLRVRLKGDLMRSHTVHVSATFTDGSAMGPVDGSRACEAESLAPLEAFLVEIMPAAAGATPVAHSPEPRAVSEAGRLRAPVKAPVRSVIATRPLTPPKSPIGGGKRR